MSGTTLRPRTLTSGYAFTECPRWHEGELYFSDMHSHTVHAVTEAGVARIVTEVPGTPGGLGWFPDGTLLVVSQEARRILRLDPDGLHVHADLGETGEAPLNDMWVDDDGTAYVGDMGFDVHAVLHPKHGQEPAEIRPGHLFRVDPSGQVAQATPDPLLFPNGIVGAGPERLYAAASFGFSVSAFARDASGVLTAEETWQLTFAPDGIAIDGDGTLWVADPAGHRAVHLGPGGDETGVVASDQQVLAVALGGSDDRTLFLCTSPGTDPDEARSLRGSRIDVVTLAQE